MAIKTRIKLTGSIGLVAFVLWLLFQFAWVVSGVLKWIAGIVFLVFAVWVIIDASKGGLTD